MGALPALGGGGRGVLDRGLAVAPAFGSMRVPVTVTSFNVASLPAAAALGSSGAAGGTYTASSAMVGVNVLLRPSSVQGIAVKLKEISP